MPFMLKSGKWAIEFLVVLCLSGCEGDPAPQVDLKSGADSQATSQPPSGQQETVSRAIAKNASPQVVLPEFYGVYAIDRGKVADLDKAPDLSPEAHFIVFDKRVSGRFTDNSIRVNRQSYDRKAYDAGMLHDCPKRMQPVKDQPEMVRIVLPAPLTPGLYQMWINFEGEEIPVFFNRTDPQLKCVNFAVGLRPMIREAIEHNDLAALTECLRYIRRANPHDPDLPGWEEALKTLEHSPLEKPPHSRE